MSAIQLELVKEESGYVEIEVFLSPEHAPNNANQPKLEGHPSEEGFACVSDEVLVKEEPISVIDESGCMDVEEVCAEDVKYEVKDEVELGPELLQQPRVTPVTASSHVLRALLDGVTPHNPDATSSEHTQSHQNNGPRKPDVCPTCGSTYRHKRSFIRHINSCQTGDLNTSEKPYVCGTCNKRFAQLINLRNHMRVHAGLITCGTCQRAFSTLTHLRRHQKIHTGETHSCTTCKEEFSSMYDLKLHRRTHTVHVCKVCNRAFSTLANLNIHELIHTGEKPHACRICKTRFRQKTALNNHMRVHTGEKPYSCDVCNKSFTFLGNLKQHRRIHFRMR